MTNNHPWCSNLARDTAIRAAEDAAASERPPVPDHRDLPERVARLEAVVFGVTESRSADARTDETSQGGLRTERVTLEVTQTAEDFVPLSEWGWHGLRHWGASSVRVVPSSEAAIPDVSDQDGDRVAIDWPGLAKVLQSERDAAIRERDAALARVAAAEARAAELEAALKILDDGQPTAPSDLGIWGTANELSARCQELAARLVAASTRATAAEARVAELEKQQADAEPVADAWGVVREGEVKTVALSCFRAIMERSASQSGGTVVPLYRAPPPPRGWLTERDRQTMIAAAVFCSGRGEKGISEALEWILARNSPPRVRLPRSINVEGPGALSWHEMRRAVTEALAAAGVEVGNE